MKEKTLRNLGRVLGVWALFAFATAGTGLAGTITKTFAFGAGTPQSHSNVRTFNVPCDLRVIATVKFKRSGPAGADNDVPIKIDLRMPDIGADEEGMIYDTNSATARRNEQTETLISTYIRSIQGCSLPWRVRVRYANAGAAPVAITGSITVDFDDSKKDIRFTSNSPLIIRKGRFDTKTIEDSFSQGRVEITATWDHYLSLGPIDSGPLPVKLQFELIDPNGRPAASDTGYSNAEINPCCSGDKMKIVFQVLECQQFERGSGKWQLKITNNTNEDAKVKEMKATLKPNCP